MRGAVHLDHDFAAPSALQQDVHREIPVLGVNLAVVVHSQPSKASRDLVVKPGKHRFLGRHDLAPRPLGLISEVPRQGVVPSQQQLGVEELRELLLPSLGLPGAHDRVRCPPPDVAEPVPARAHHCEGPHQVRELLARELGTLTPPQDLHHQRGLLDVAERVPERGHRPNQVGDGLGRRLVQARGEARAELCDEVLTRVVRKGGVAP